LGVAGAVQACPAKYAEKALLTFLSIVFAHLSDWPEACSLPFDESVAG
jgi:hypothetical protein